MTLEKELSLSLKQQGYSDKEILEACIELSQDVEVPSNQIPLNQRRIQTELARYDLTQRCKDREKEKSVKEKIREKVDKEIQKKIDELDGNPTILSYKIHRRFNVLGTLVKCKCGSPISYRVIVKTTSIKDLNSAKVYKTRGKEELFKYCANCGDFFQYVGPDPFG